MNWVNVAAIIGAAGWVPHIITWFHYWFIKPKLRFVPESFTEIGYTPVGPIFNQTFAISSLRKDALVEKIETIITHESRVTHRFIWRTLDEKGAEITSLTTGERAEFRKYQTAIALKVSTVGLIEKKIGFQDIEYQNRLLNYISALNEKIDYLKRIKKEGYQEEALKTEEFLKTLDFIKDGFYWREGKYDVCFRVFETSLKKPHTEYFRFELSKKDAAQLEKNIEITQDNIRDLVLYEGKPIQEWPRRVWKWVNPSFYRI